MRYKFLFQSKQIFAISESVRQDLLRILGFQDDEVINVRGAEIPNFLSVGADTKNAQKT